MKRIFKLSIVFLILATIYFVIGSGTTFINSMLIFTFLATMICVSWALFSWANKSVYLRLILLAGGFLYIYYGGAKDAVVLSYIVVVFIGLGLIHGVIEVFFLKKTKGIKDGFKLLFEQVSNYNTVIVISFIMVFLDDFIFSKISSNFYMDYFEVLVSILIYYLILEVSILKTHDEMGIETEVFKKKLTDL